MKQIFCLVMLVMAFAVSAGGAQACDIVGQPINRPCGARYNKVPDSLSFGAGYFDVFQNTPRLEAIDFRLEYRWGYSILSGISGRYRKWDRWFQLRPFAGIETSSRGQLYGFGGFLFDFMLGRHVVITPSTAVGVYERGDGKYLGSFVEFRTGIEAGWRFDNNVRLTGYLAHISNAKMTEQNPGAETMGIYLHIPTRMIFGN